MSDLPRGCERRLQHGFTQSDARVILGEVACAEVIHVPVRFETYGTVGGDSVIDWSSAVNGASAGSIIDDWNACEV